MAQDRPYRDATLAELTVDHGMRPKMPPLPAAQDHHRQKGRHLAAIHRMYLREMTQIGQFLDDIDAGRAAPAGLVNAIGGAKLVRNMQLFGTLCGRECQVLTFHHNAEEDMIFPQLNAQQIPALTQVVERLKTEHLVVHELLIRLDDAAQNLAADQTAEHYETARAIYKQLFAVVRSHFGYEETELQEALGLYVPVI